MTYPQTPRTTAARYQHRVGYDRAAVHALLDEAYLCHLSFAVDGEPRILPTLFVRVDDTIYLHGSTGSTPALAARADGAPVSVAVTELDALILARSQFNHSANYRSLVAHGRAVPVTDEDTKRTVLDALMNKVGPGRAGHTRPPTRAELAATAVLALPLVEVSLKQRTGGVRDDREDLALPYWAGVVPFVTRRGPAETDHQGVRATAPGYVSVRSPWHTPVTLTGDIVRLEPLRLDDAAEMLAALDDEEVHRHIPAPRPADLDAARATIAATLARQDAGQAVAFAQRDAVTGEFIGVTSYHDILPERDTLAIGGTQLAKPRWRTGANTEAKVLLLTHAFEVIGAGRVEWHTDIRNTRSQAAIERLGAVREGVLRRHRRRADGSWRDTVLYSMTVEEWPSAKKALVARLAAGQTEHHVARHH